MENKIDVLTDNQRKFEDNQKVMENKIVVLTDNQKVMENKIEVLT